MPNFWHAEIQLSDTEKFLVKARPNGPRGNRLLSWLPFRTGDKFTAKIEVSRLSGNKPIHIQCTLREPDQCSYINLSVTNPCLPFKDSTYLRFLPITGEYVLRVDLLSIDPTTGVPGLPAMNRRLISLFTFSQDAGVANFLMILLGAGIGAGLTLLIR